MKVAIITDQHFGCRKNSKLFHDYFLKFYNDIFFPTLEKEGISVVIDMGDTFDNRQGINFGALAWAKDNYYDRLRDMGVHVHTIVGNHTAYYKNTNQINAVDLLLREYSNVSVYSKAKEVELDNLKVLFIPWINQENEEETLKLIKDTSCKIVMGHLELSGFRAHRGHIMENGMDTNFFDKFEKVYSGHYHTRSSDGKIFYLGNPYEMFWNDVNDTRGFHIFDTETLDQVAVDNPYKLFYNLYYEDQPHQLLDAKLYEEKIVKVIVRKKSNPKKFEKFIDKLYDAGVAELKIVETYDFDGWYQSDDPKTYESEDTMSILNRYIDEAEVDLNKSEIKNIMRVTYQQACEMI